MPADAHRIIPGKQFGETESALRVRDGCQGATRRGFTQFDLRPGHDVSPGIAHGALPGGGSDLRGQLRRRVPTKPRQRQ